MIQQFYINMDMGRIGFNDFVPWWGTVGGAEYKLSLPEDFSDI